MPFFIFPVFFIYTLLIVSPREWNPLYLWIFLLPTLFFLYGIGDHFIWNGYDRAGLEELYNNPPAIYHFFYKGNSLYIIIGLLWLLRKINLEQHNLKENFSQLEHMQFNWLKIFTLLYLIITSLTIIAFIISNLQLVELDIPTVYLGLNSALTLSLFYFTINGIRHYVMEEILQQQIIPVEPVTNSPTTPSHVQVDLAESIQKKLTLLFKQDQLFLRPNLTLNELAEEVGVPPYQLSNYLNQGEGKSFFDFVNTYRLDHLKKLLISPDHSQFTILALGLESGFNSKASINRVFKQQTGTTPSQYRRAQLLKKVSSS